LNTHLRYSTEKILAILEIISILFQKFSKVEAADIFLQFYKQLIMNKLLILSALFLSSFSLFSQKPEALPNIISEPHPNLKHRKIANMIG
jgi:L-lactate permease